MMVPVSDPTLRDVRDAMLRAVKSVDGVVESWLGPRSTELGFVMENGVEVTLVVQARERQA